MSTRMNGGAAAAAKAAVAAAAIANAIKASGAIVRVEPRDFQKIVERCEAPLVVIAPGGFFRARHNDLSLLKKENHERHRCRL